MKAKSMDKIYVALDTVSLEEAQSLARLLKGKVGGVKLGKEFFSAHGPQGVSIISREGLPIFLDLKFHDIPNTVEAAIKASVPLNLSMLNVHVSGGLEMMRAAKRAAREETKRLKIPCPLILGVTVLTSLDDKDLDKVGVGNETSQQVELLTKLAMEAGLDGVVCSPAEIRSIRKIVGNEFVLVTPGVRPEWAVKGDQKRVTGPREAIEAGSSFLVIGRPITASNDPLEALSQIQVEVNGGN